MVLSAWKCTMETIMYRCKVRPLLRCYAIHALPRWPNLLVARCSAERIHLYVLPWYCSERRYPPGSKLNIQIIWTWYSTEKWCYKSIAVCTLHHQILEHFLVWPVTTKVMMAVWLCVVYQFTNWCDLPSWVACQPDLLYDELCWVADKLYGQPLGRNTDEHCTLPVNPARSDTCMWATQMLVLSWCWLKTQRLCMEGLCGSPGSRMVALSLMSHTMAT